jgi:hypothetical protein
VANAKSIWASIDVGSLDRAARRASRRHGHRGRGALESRASEEASPAAVAVHTTIVQAGLRLMRPGYGELSDVDRRLGSGAIVALMKPAHLRRRNDAASRWGQDRARDWRILLEREMRSRLHVVGDVSGEHALEPRSVDDDDVIETLPPDRSDDALHEPVLPR